MHDPQIKEIIIKIKQDFPNDAADISDALEILSLALDGLRDNANRRMKAHADEKDYEKSTDFLQLSKAVSSLQETLLEYTSILVDEKETDEVFEPDISQEQREIPNYAAYTVDSTVPHTLYDSFTHKKATAFSINGIRYEAKDWKDVLLQTCDILSEIDAEKFYNFIDDPSMRGRKITYFGLQHFDRKNAKIKNIDVYVWTNLSANDIRNLIRKILKKYDIKIADYLIYLRADYTPLHSEDTASSVSQHDEFPPEKIGKCVRATMRQFSKRRRIFTKTALNQMQSKQWSKATLDINYPLLRPFVDGLPLSEQIKEGEYGRYWKEIFEFDGKKFLVTSQWYEHSRDLFSAWIKPYLL